MERLSDWVEGRLTADEARAVEEQVAGSDEATRATVAWLRAFARVSEKTVSVSPPPEVRRGLEELFEVRAEGRRGRPGFLGSLVAALSFDSRSQPAFGTRSAAGPRQIIYTTDLADIALNLRPRPGGRSLDVHCRVLTVGSAESGPFAVQLLEGEVGVATTVTDELGRFSFEAVPPGAYGMVASGEGVEITVPAIDLRP